MAVAIPSNLDTVVVRGRFAAFDGSSMSGSITFTPTITTIVSPSTGTILLARPIVGKVVDGELFAADGVSPLRLFATDDPDVSVTGWQYVVTEALSSPSRPSYRISVPVTAGSTGLDLWKLADTVPASVAGVSYVVLPAFTSLEARVARIESGTVTIAPLTTWRQALANRKLRSARWLAIGDSWTEGQGASTRAKRWVDLVAAGLRTTYPSAARGGTGYTPGGYAVYGPDSTWASTLTVASGSVAVQSWAMNLGNRVAVFNANAVASFTTFGTSVDLWFLNESPSAFTVAVDGTTVMAVPGATYDTGSRTRFQFSARGSHVVRLTAGSSGGSLGGWTSYDGDEHSGITVFDAAHTGYFTDSYNGTVTDGSPWRGVDADLVSIFLGANDLGRNTTAATIRANLATLIANVRRGSTGLPSIVLCLYPPASLSSGSLTLWATYRAAILDLATAEGCAVLDLAAGPVVPLASDAIHPTDVGQSVVASAFLALVS